MSDNFTKKRNNLVLTVTPPRQCISLTLVDPTTHLQYEDMISYDDLSTDFKFVFGNVGQLYNAMRQGAQLNFDRNGQVTMECALTIGSKVVERTMKLQLKGRVSGNEDIRMIRRDVESYKHQVNQLKQQVAGLKEQNNQLNVKFKYLEQLSQMNLMSQVPAQAPPPPTFSDGFGHETQPLQQEVKPQEVKPEKVEEKTVPIKVEQKTVPKQEEDITSAKKEEQEPEEEPYQEQDGVKKYKKIPFKLSPSCTYLDKYKVEGQSVTSLCQDYYQLYFDEPLPKKGCYLVRVKIPGSIHGSIGIIGESQLGNQYSFQNKKSICFYSYSYGNFRGIYTQGNYSSLTWPIKENEIVNIELDMGKKQLTYWMEGMDEETPIDFSQLAKEEGLRLFFELYQKECTLEFL